MCGTPAAWVPCAAHLRANTARTHSAGQRSRAARRTCLTAAHTCPTCTHCRWTLSTHTTRTHAHMPRTHCTHAPHALQVDAEQPPDPGRDMQLVQRPRAAAHWHAPQHLPHSCAGQLPLHHTGPARLLRNIPPAESPAPQVWPAQRCAHIPASWVPQHAQNVAGSTHARAHTYTHHTHAHTTTHTKHTRTTTHTHNHTHAHAYLHARSCARTGTQIRHLS